MISIRYACKNKIAPGFILCLSLICVKLYGDEINGVYEFNSNKSVIRNNTEYTTIHRIAILALDKEGRFDFYYETQNEIFRTKGTFTIQNDTILSLNSNTFHDLNLLLKGELISFPVLLADDYMRIDTLLVLTKNPERTLLYPWTISNKDNLRNHINNIRMDSLDWDITKYEIVIDSIHSKLNYPKPLTIVNGQPLYDLELDFFNSKDILELEVLTGMEAKQVYGSRGQNGAIFIKLVNGY